MADNTPILLLQFLNSCLYLGQNRFGTPSTLLEVCGNNNADETINTQSLPFESGISQRTTNRTKKRRGKAVFSPVRLLAVAMVLPRV